MTMMLEIPNKPTLRPDEVARILGCSGKHVRCLVEDGSLEAVDIRCKFLQRPAWRIMRESVAEFIQKRKTIP